MCKIVVLLYCDVVPRTGPTRGVIQSYTAAAAVTLKNEGSRMTKHRWVWRAFSKVWCGNNPAGSRGKLQHTATDRLVTYPTVTNSALFHMCPVL